MVENNCSTILGTQHKTLRHRTPADPPCLPRYYFLPWSDQEPFVTVHCDFEDVTHRLHCVNHIISIINILKKDLDVLRSHLRGNLEKEANEAVSGAIANLVEACSLELPEVDPVRHTETSLDTHLRGRRRRELDSVREAVQGMDVADPQHVVEELESVLGQLELLAEEPQSSIPDVFLWLMSGTRRMAYVRIPAHSILHAHQPTAQGMLSGKFNTYTLTNPGEHEVTFINL
ncbi:Myoferlin [Chionoecetes opilio]|uniref:Myoferlin n=1 Tax=Chionoecetes opilio TaxID=41210 RepID=A0A8J4Y8G8_CHIOP|nr:Myoferlin [Chionoecetes opilio]